MDWQLGLTAVVCTLSWWGIFKLKNKYGVNEKDYLSEMPDDVIDLISSRLSMRDRLKIRSLSRRWRHAPVSLGVRLNFDSDVMFGTFKLKLHECRRHQHRFVTGVCQALVYFSGPSIRSLRVSYCLTEIFTPTIDLWVSYALLKGVEELEILCRCTWSPPNFGISLYNPKLRMKYEFSTQLLSDAWNLKFLRLNTCLLQPNMKGRCNSLKTLFLEEIPLRQYHLQHLLLICPKLEKLTLYDCRFIGTKLRIAGLLLQLKTLIIEEPAGLEEVELSAGKLTTFQYFGTIIKFTFLWVPALKNLLLMTPWNRPYIHELVARHVPQLQYLMISGPLNAERLEHTFKNVVCLDMHLRGGALTRLPMSFIAILNACPHVQKFTLMMESGKIGGAYTDVGCFEAPWKFQVERRFHASLKEVHIGGFCGSDIQMEMVIYLLRHAVALERMSISSYFKFEGAGFMRWEGFVPLGYRKRQWVADQLRGKAISKRAELTLQSTPVQLF